MEGELSHLVNSDIVDVMKLKVCFEKRVEVVSFEPSVQLAVWYQFRPCLIIKGLLTLWLTLIKLSVGIIGYSM